MTTTLNIRFVLCFVFITAQAFGLLHAQSEEDREAFRRKSSFNFMILESMYVAGSDNPWSKSLEVLPSQQALVKEIMYEHKARQNEWMKARDEAQKSVLTNNRLTEAEKQKRLEKIQYEQLHEFSRLIDASMKKIKTVLLPHQYKALRQLAAQEQLLSDIRLYGIKGFENILEHLGLEDDKRREVKTTVKEVQKEYEEELAALRKEFEQKMKEKLPVKARSKLNERFGEWHYFDR